MSSGASISEAPASTEFAGRRVLVVEDTMLLADYIAEYLQEHGCEVVGPVPRLARALVAAKQERLDAALLDVNLAGEQCFPAAAILRMRDVPFAFLSGYGEEAIPAEFRGTPSLHKPFHSNELIGLVRSLLGGVR